MKARSWIEKVHNDLSVQKNNLAETVPSPPQHLLTLDGDAASAIQPPAPPVASTIEIDQTVTHYRNDNPSDLVSLDGQADIGIRRVN